MSQLYLHKLRPEMQPITFLGLDSGHHCLLQIENKEREVILTIPSLWNNFLGGEGKHFCCPNARQICMRGIEFLLQKLCRVTMLKKFNSLFLIVQSIWGPEDCKFSWKISRKVLHASSVTIAYNIPLCLSFGHMIFIYLYWLSIY